MSEELNKIIKEFSHPFLEFEEGVSHIFNEKIYLGWQSLVPDEHKEENLCHELGHLVNSTYNQATSRKNWGFEDRKPSHISNDFFDRAYKSEIQNIIVAWKILNHVDSYWSFNLEAFCKENSETLLLTMRTFFHPHIIHNYFLNNKYDPNDFDRVQSLIKKDIKENIFKTKLDFQTIKKIFNKKINHYYQKYQESQYEDLSLVQL